MPPVNNLDLKKKMEYDERWICGIETRMSPKIIASMCAAEMETIADLCINARADIEVQTTLKRNIWRKRQRVQGRDLIYPMQNKIHPEHQDRNSRRRKANRENNKKSKLPDKEPQIEPIYTNLHKQIQCSIHS